MPPSKFIVNKISPKVFFYFFNLGGLLLRGGEISGTTFSIELSLLLLL